MTRILRFYYQRSIHPSIPATGARLSAYTWIIITIPINPFNDSMAATYCSSLAGHSQKGGTREDTGYRQQNQRHSQQKGTDRLARHAGQDRTEPSLLRVLLLEIIRISSHREMHDRRLDRLMMMVTEKKRVLYKVCDNLHGYVRTLGFIFMHRSAAGTILGTGSTIIRLLKYQGHKSVTCD